MEHQRQALRFIKKLDGKCGLFLAPGTGNTLVAIRYARLNLPALIICRRDDFLTWKNELAEEKVPTVSCHFIDKGSQIPQQPYKWTMVTYDLLKNEFVKKYILQSYFKIVITDESHMIKHWESNRTKTVFYATRKIDKRIAMTGTPITNEVRDVFSQSKFIDNGKTFGDNLWRFNNTYYLKSGPGWYLRHDSKRRVIEKLKAISFYVHEDDVLTLPPKRHLIKSAPMTSEQKEMYNRLLTLWEYEIENKTIELNQILTQLGKLKQVASGFIYDESGVAHFLNSGKLNLLANILKDYLKEKLKVVIWCSYTAEIKMISKLLDFMNEKYVTFYSSNRKRKEKARMDFKDDSQIRFFIGQVDSGVGMNELKVADTAIYYSNSFKVVSRQQSMRRIRRKGSENHKVITYYDLITEDSVDQHVLDSITRKFNLADFILNKIKEGKHVSELLK